MLGFYSGGCKRRKRKKLQFTENVGAVGVKGILAGSSLEAFEVLDRLFLQRHRAMETLRFGVTTVYLCEQFGLST